MCMFFVASFLYSKAHQEADRQYKVSQAADTKGATTSPKKSSYTLWKTEHLIIRVDCLLLRGNIRALEKY